MKRTEAVNCCSHCFMRRNFQIRAILTRYTEQSFVVGGIEDDEYVRRVLRNRGKSY